MLKHILKNIGVVVLGIIALFAASYAFAWTAPSANPPGSNASAPLTVGATSQTKSGNLALNTTNTWANALLIPYGNVGIGTYGPTQELQVHGQIYSSLPGATGGIRFADNTVQTTAATATAITCNWSGWNIAPPTGTCRSDCYWGCKTGTGAYTSVYCSGGKITQYQNNAACCTKCEGFSW